MTDEIRYGIFLRPDPATCWNVTQITFAIKRQFGLVSAGAFPPHATLIGNLATDASPETLVSRLAPVFATVQEFPVYNAGVLHTKTNGYEYVVNLDKHAEKPNQPLNAVALAVKAAVLPLSRPVNDFLVTPVPDYEFAGHLGLASHELAVDPSLSEEIGEFIAGLTVAPPPAMFSAQWYSLFEFRSDWTGHWWQTMTWRHLHSWKAR